MENKDKNNKLRDIVIMIIILVIIILLLLHNCVLNGKKNSDNTNIIDICDGENCEVKPGLRENYIDCLTDVDNEYCVIPDFTGKTKKDVQKWLDYILNNIDITYNVLDSTSKNGIILGQSNEKGLTVKDLLDGNIPLIITFANSKSDKVDCLVDVKNKACVVPDFTGKIKKDVLDWLNNISNNINTKYSNKESSSKNGTITGQSVKKGVTVKELLESNNILEIIFAKNDKVDCLTDENNKVCIMPNFTGDTKKEFENWLNSISNTINYKYSVKKSNSKNGTIIGQSLKPGNLIKDLLVNNKTLEITFANREDTKVDCLKNPNVEACIVPDFTGKTKKDVQDWFDGILNDFNINYEVLDSDVESGKVIGQSNKNITVKDLIDENKSLDITISEKKTTPVINPTPVEEGEFVVKDSNIEWNKETEINIFGDPDTKIAPESSGTYRFELNNNTIYNLKYSILFTENNPYNINMKYKLRKNNTYIIDEYVLASELNLNDIMLNSSKSDTFYLEWKWVSSDNDTEVGQIGNAKYTLKISIDAEGV